MKYAPLTSGYNALVGGSSPLGPTTQSRATGEFLVACEIPRIRECLCDLARDPVRGRMRCDVDPDEISAGQSHDDEGIERVEAKGWGNEYDTTPGSRRLSSRVSEQPGRLDQQHQGRDQIEYGQLDLGKELN